MKKVKVKNKKSASNKISLWLLTALVIIMAFLIITLEKSKDSRSRANDSVEPGVVLPVASDR